MIAPTLNASPRTGPYEAWIFGQTGAAYEAAALEIDPIVACLGEVDGALTDPRAMEAAMAQGAPAIATLGRLRTIKTPTLWREAFATPGACGAHILPGLALFASPRAELSQRLDRDGLGGAMGELATPTPEYGFRLNTPLPRAGYDVAFVDAPATLVPDPATKEWVDARPADFPGKPLAIVAVIDDGLAFAHPHLRGADGAPRVECCWLQGAPAGVGAQAGRVLFGRELLRGDIAALSGAYGADEAGLYAQAGGAPVGSGRWSPLAHAATHGAMALDIAAGFRHAAGASESAANLDRVRVVGVELPPAAVIDTTGFGLEAYILAAFHYVFRRADEIAAAYGLTRAQVPLIVNFSFGVSGGPHDGKDRLEEALAHLVERREALGGPTTVTMPAGNEFLAALHGELRAADADGDGDAKIRWRTQPCDRTSSYLEIWSPPCAKGAEAAQQPKFLRLRPPGATAPLTFVFPALLPAPPSIAAPCALFDLSIAGRVVGQISLDLFRGYRWRAMVILAPSESRDPALPTAPAGLWTVGVDVSTLGADQVVDCRIQRDNAGRHPWQGGRQSRFDDPRDRSFDATGAPAQDDAGAAFARRFGTLNGFATHDRALVVAGVDAATGKPALYSSAGSGAPTASGGGCVATAAASDDSPALRGQRAAGSRAASVGRWIGVSAAAPRVARRAAIAWLDGHALHPVAGVIAHPRLGAPYTV